jgi:integrase
VLSATWDQFDLETGVWRKPSSHTKQKREHRVPLSAPALQLLADMKAGATSGYLFPNPNGTGHQVDLKRTWQTLCKEAGIVEIVGHKTTRKGERVPILQHTARVHDLRHTYASMLASAGASLPLIGSLLGHTQPATTARYAHLLDDPQRRATDSVGAAFEAATEGTTAKIIPMKKAY